MEEQTCPTLKTKQSKRPVEGLLPKPLSNNPSTVLALIERVALDPRVDVEKLERMMELYERLKAKEAELAYNEAKGRILKKLARIKIVKNRSVLYEVEKGKPQKGTYEAFNRSSPLTKRTALRMFDCGTYLIRNHLRRIGLK